jgi:hypothetical protein
MDMWRVLLVDSPILEEIGKVHGIGIIFFHILTVDLEFIVATLATGVIQAL